MTPPQVPPTSRDPSAGDVILTGADLTIADVEAVARGGASVRLDDDARGRMQEARDVIEALVDSGAVVYGVTTGFGDLATTYIVSVVMLALLYPACLWYRTFKAAHPDSFLKYI